MENYEVLKLIGKGNFGSISKVIRKSDNKLFVWKELDYGRMSEKEKQNIVSEVNILRELRHPNIVRYEDRVIDKKNTKIYIIMEFCEGGDIGQLIKRLKKKKEYIPEEVVWKILTQLVLALHECHNHKEGKILHRDIKPSNVFLDGDNNVKLGDFGLSRILSDESVFAYSHVGTPYYMSPEQIEEVRYNDKSDLWSLGCFLYELTTFNPPFEATNQLSLALKIKAGKVESVSSKYSNELNNIILWLLSVDQNRRPNIDELLNLPQIVLRIRERKLKENYLKMKKMEESLKEREASINLKESEFLVKENNILNREKDIQELEKQLNTKELELHEKEMQVNTMNDNLIVQMTKLNQRNKQLFISNGDSFQIDNRCNSNSFASTNDVNVNKFNQQEDYLNTNMNLNVNPNKNIKNNEVNENENIYTLYQINSKMNKSENHNYSNTQKQIVPMDAFMSIYDQYNNQSTNHSNNRNMSQTDQINSYLTDDKINYQQNTPIIPAIIPNYLNMPNRTCYPGLTSSLTNPYINPPPTMSNSVTSLLTTTISQRKPQVKYSIATPSSVNSVKNSIQKSVIIKKTMSLKLPTKL